MTSSNSEQDPTKPTVPAHDDAPTHATVPAHGDAPTIVGSDAPTAATIPANASPTAETVTNVNPDSSPTAATHLQVDSARGAKAASGSHQGEVWGDFELDKMLGRGGMGAVYRGRQISLDRPVAIKLLSEHLTHSDDFRKRFLLEARAAARINSPYVVQVYFAGSHVTPAGEEIHFFAMEYVKGTDLAHHLKHGFKPTPKEALGLVIQAARSLVTLSEHQIVHRDIKPANYMLTEKGDLKLMDFGLVKFASEAHGLTQTGTVMGTVNYFSPEQGRGEVCDHRTDIYALGVMFYELLTGKLPFSGGDATSVIYQHIHAEPKPPRIHNPAVSDPFQSIVLKCLAKRPEDRYQTAALLLADLERAARGERPLAADEQPRGTTAIKATPAKQRQRLTVAAALVIAAIILAIAIVVRPTGDSKPEPTEVTATLAQHAPGTEPTPTSPQTPVVASDPTPTPEPKPPEPTTPIVAPAPEPIPTPEPVVAQVTPTPEPTPSIPANVTTPDSTPTPPTPDPAVAQPTPAPEPVVVENPTPTPAPVEPTPTTPITTPEPPAPQPEPVVAVVTPTPEPAPELVTPITPTPEPVTPITPPEPPKPITISAPVQTTTTIELPKDHELGTGPFLWWLSGETQQLGRLMARTTTASTNAWIAPGLPTTAKLHVAAMGSAKTLELSLTATEAPIAAKATLTPFARAFFANERRIKQLERDESGAWWLLDVDEASLMRMHDGWLLSDKAQLTPMPRRPSGMAFSKTHMAVIDKEDAYVLRIYNQDGSLHRTATGLQRPTDVIAGPGNAWYVADQVAGGILVFNNDAVRMATLARSGAGATGFEQLTTIATDGQLIHALDIEAQHIVVFDGPQVVTTWKLEPGDRPVAIRGFSDGIYCLLRNGMVRVLDKKGQIARVILAAADRFPGESLGYAVDCYRDVTGEVYVTYPDREIIVRHSLDGSVAIRHARTLTRRAYAADAVGHLYTINPDLNRIDVIDSDGWRQRTIGGPLGKDGGTFDSPIMIAAAADGKTVAVYDEETYRVSRFDLSTNSVIEFGGKGSEIGQFQEPAAIAVDTAGRTYVLDSTKHTVMVFDADGKVLLTVGSYERGDTTALLRIPRTMCVSPDGDQVFVYDEERMYIKRFAIDWSTNQIRHMGNIGGRGTEPGQFTRVTAMGCDRRGLLYVLDYKRADLQVFNLAGAEPGTPIAIVNGKEAGIRRMQYLALDANGLPFVIGGDMLTGLRWQP